MIEVEPDKHFDDKSDVEVEAEFLRDPATSFIVLARMYDLLAVIARAVSLEDAEKVLEAHERGEIIGPVPMLGQEEETS